MSEWQVCIFKFTEAVPVFCCCFFTQCFDLVHVHERQRERERVCLCVGGWWCNNTIFVKLFDQVTVLYFLRNRTDKDVDPSHMERDIFCGELKHNTIEALSSLLSDIYIPIVRAQNDWGHCNEDGRTHLMHSMDKFVIALNETAASMRHSRQWVSWPCTHESKEWPCLCESKDLTFSNIIKNSVTQEVED